MTKDLQVHGPHQAGGDEDMKKYSGMNRRCTPAIKVSRPTFSEPSTRVDETAMDIQINEATKKP